MDKTEIAECDILKPGSTIRPIFTMEDTKELLERLYGIVPLKISELVSYDDKNFFITVDRTLTKSPEAYNWPHGYVLKVLNTLDSRNPNFVDAQTKLMLFLNEHGIHSSRPVQNITGQYYTLEKLGTTHNVVRLLEFLPGKTFCQVPGKMHLYYEVGECVAKIDVILEEFSHAEYEKRTSLWMLQSVPRLTEFLFCLTDSHRLGIVNEVMAEFNTKVMSRLSDFETGIIHGDFNEQNIIVEKTSPQEMYHVSGVIDFGDTVSSPYVFELAIAMAYMILQSETLEVGGIVRAGYLSVKTLKQDEQAVLKVCVAARLCQSLVLGLYTHVQDPGNSYLLTTQAVGWKMLELLWSTPDESLEEMWNNFAKLYNKSKSSDLDDENNINVHFSKV